MSHSHDPLLDLSENDLKEISGNSRTCRRPYLDAMPCSPTFPSILGEGSDYHDLCANCAWAVFFRSHGWDKVECVQCEIGRFCAIHPENDPDVVH